MKKPCTFTVLALGLLVLGMLVGCGTEQQMLKPVLLDTADEIMTEDPNTAEPSIGESLDQIFTRKYQDIDWILVENQVNIPGLTGLNDVYHHPSENSCITFQKTFGQDFAIRIQCPKDYSHLLEAAREVDSGDETEIELPEESTPEIEFDLPEITTPETPQVIKDLEEEYEYRVFHRGQPRTAFLFHSAAEAITHETVKQFFRDTEARLKEFCVDGEGLAPRLGIEFSNRQASVDFVEALPGTYLDRSLKEILPNTVRDRDEALWIIWSVDIITIVDNQPHFYLEVEINGVVACKGKE